MTLYEGQYIFWVSSDSEQDMESVIEYAAGLGLQSTLDEPYVETHETFLGGSTGSSTDLSSVPLNKRHSIVRWCQRYVTTDPETAMLMELRVG